MKLAHRPCHTGEASHAEPEISAIICTRQRANYLSSALSGLRGQTLAFSRFEVLVVDNGSTDDTRKVVESYADPSWNLRYIFEPRIGLSYARNRGAFDARCGLLAFIDDDAIASPDWLEQAVNVWSDEWARVGVVGGRVKAIWESPRPPWLGDDLLPFLSILDEDKRHESLSAGTPLVGANMIFNAEAFRSVGGFSGLLGRVGNTLLSNEELEITLRIQRQGYLAAYHPEVVVSHLVAKARLERAWFRRRCHWQGRSDALCVRLQPEKGPLEWRAEQFRRCVLECKTILRMLLFTSVSERHSLFRIECRLHWLFGYIIEALPPTRRSWTST
jgi:glycosyltransferase involved in cell wall biosynthesis